MRCSLKKSSLDHLYFVACFYKPIIVKRYLHKSSSGHTHLVVTANVVSYNFKCIAIKIAVFSPMFKVLDRRLHWILDEIHWLRSLLEEDFLISVLKGRTFLFLFFTLCFSLMSLQMIASKLLQITPPYFPKNLN